MAGKVAVDLIYLPSVFSHDLEGASGPQHDALALLAKSLVLLLDLGLRHNWKVLPPDGPSYHSTIGTAPSWGVWYRLFRPLLERSIPRPSGNFVDTVLVKLVGVCRHFVYTVGVYLYRNKMREVLSNSNEKKAFDRVSKNFLG